MTIFIPPHSTQKPFRNLRLPCNSKAGYLHSFVERTCSFLPQLAIRTSIEKFHVPGLGVLAANYANDANRRVNKSIDAPVRVVRVAGQSGRGGVSEASRLQSRGTASCRSQHPRQRSHDDV